MRDFVYISDRAYTKDQVLGMEKIMLNTLKFNLTVPTPHNFLTRFLKVGPVKCRCRSSALCSCADMFVPF